MKRFQFSLAKLLRYKEQLLDVERGVLAEMNARLNALNGELMELQNELKRSGDELNRKYTEGITAPEIARHKTYLDALMEAIRQKEWEIRLQQQAVDRQTDKLREAKLEISTLEKLRERKLEEYTYLENKQNELFIEEFVGNQRAVSLQQG